MMEVMGRWDEERNGLKRNRPSSLNFCALGRVPLLVTIYGDLAVAWAGIRDGCFRKISQITTFPSDFFQNKSFYPPKFLMALFLVID